MIDRLPSGCEHRLNISQPPQRYTHKIVVGRIAHRLYMGLQAITTPTFNTT